MTGKPAEEHRSPQHHADVYILHASTHQRDDTAIDTCLFLGLEDNTPV